MSDSGNQKQREDDLASKLININYKRFYIDVKQNRRGRFIKISEIGAKGKSRVLLSMIAAQQICEKLTSYIEFAETTPEVKDRQGTDELKTDVLNFDTRRYYLDLKENARGRFLRIAQTSPIPHTRSQVVIPAQGMAEVKGVIEEFIAKFGEGFMEGPSGDNNTKVIKADLHKMFYFDLLTNERGSFVRVTEVKGAYHFRSTITIPSANLAAFRDVLDELVEKDATTTSQSQA